MPSRTKPLKNQKPKRSKRSERQAAARQALNSVAAIKPLFELGLQAYQQGQLAQAVEALQDHLQADPVDGDAWHVLGLSLYALGQPAEAIDCLHYAIQFCPDNPEIQSNTAGILKSVGRLDLAQEILEATTAKFPQHVGAAVNLGSVYLEQDNLELAGDVLERALVLDPGSSFAAMNLANLWMRQGRVLDAERQYRRLAAGQTPELSLRTNWAESLRKLGRFDEAVELLGPIVGELNPELNSGNRNDRSVAASVQDGAKAVPLPAAITLGRCLISLDRNDEARLVLEQAKNEHPESAQLHHYLGQIEFADGNLTQAEACLTKAAGLAPHDAFVCSRLGLTLLELNNRPAAIEHLRRAIEINPEDAVLGSFLMFTLSGDESLGSQSLFEAHLDWGKAHGRIDSKADELVAQPHDWSGDRRLRIGYLSPDFCNHAVALFFEPVLRSHDANAVETYCYSETALADEVTARLKQASNHWRDTRGKSNLQVAQQIADDQIDVLVDLAGHTANNRLLVFPYRAAPVQMTWMGYPNTTGLDCIDYRITCETQNPIDEPSYHVEKLIRMPHGSFCFSKPGFETLGNDLPALKNGYLTFGSLHRPSKMSSRTYDLWAGVMCEFSESKMLLYNTRFKDETKQSVLEEFAKRGVDRDRVQVQSGAPQVDYLEAYHEIDVALDVTPWAGATTTLGALWMGVPVVAFDGGRRSARSTVAIVNAIGQPDWAAKTNECYVETVASLCSDLSVLVGIRQGLRSQLEATVLNAKRFTRELESQYRKAWQKRAEA